MSEAFDQARRMLDAFASVGATGFDASRIDIDGKLVAFRPNVPIADLKRMLPPAMESAARERNSLTVRPHGSVPLIQLDDLNAERLARVAPYAFLTLETSPNNYQGWIAVDGADKDLARRLKKSTAADPTASGAVRLAGTKNFKTRYSPDFPTVTIIEAHPARIATPDQLQHLLAPPDPPKTWLERVSTSRPRKWPDYQRVLAGAPVSNDGSHPDVSKADYFFALMSAQRFWRVDEIATRLLEVSPKAKDAGERYARRTAEAAVKANQDRPR